MTPERESGAGRCATTCQGQWTPPAWKARPVNIMPHLPAFLRHRRVTRYARLRAELTGVRLELDGLDRGVIEAGLTGSRALERITRLYDFMREHHPEGGLLPAAEAAPEGDLREMLRMPPGHPESLTAELDGADEEMLVGLCTELWPGDEWADFAADSYGERWPEGSS
jgi:hypothetical protein